MNDVPAFEHLAMRFVSDPTDQAGCQVTEFMSDDVVEPIFSKKKTLESAFPLQSLPIECNLSIPFY